MPSSPSMSLNTCARSSCCSMVSLGLKPCKHRHDMPPVRCIALPLIHTHWCCSALRCGAVNALRRQNASPATNPTWMREAAQQHRAVPLPLCPSPCRGALATLSRRCASAGSRLLSPCAMRAAPGRGLPCQRWLYAKPEATSAASRPAMLLEHARHLSVKREIPLNKDVRSVLME